MEGGDEALAGGAEPLGDAKNLSRPISSLLMMLAEATKCEKMIIFCEEVFAKYLGEDGKTKLRYGPGCL